MASAGRGPRSAGAWGPWPKRQVSQASLEQGMPGPASLKPEPQGERGSRLDLCCLWVSLSSSLASKTPLQQRQLRTWALAIHLLPRPPQPQPRERPGNRSRNCSDGRHLSCHPSLEPESLCRGSRHFPRALALSKVEPCLGPGPLGPGAPLPAKRGRRIRWASDGTSHRVSPPKVPKVLVPVMGSRVLRAPGLSQDFLPASGASSWKHAVHSAHHRGL